MRKISITTTEETVSFTIRSKEGYEDFIREMQDETVKVIEIKCSDANYYFAKGYIVRFSIGKEVTENENS